MHGKIDLARAKGLKKSELNQLNRLLQRRIPTDKVVTIDFAESVAEISQNIGQALSVVVNRRGQIVNVTLGQPWQVNVPELRQVRVGPGRLCGHRIIPNWRSPQVVKRTALGPVSAMRTCNVWPGIALIFWRKLLWMSGVTSANPGENRAG